MRGVFIVVLAAGFIAAQTASATDLTGKWGIGARVGGAVPFGSEVIRDRGDLGYASGARIRYGLDKNWGFLIDYDNLDLGGPRMRAHTLNVGALYTFASDQTFTPYVLGGIGGANLRNIPMTDNEYTGPGMKLGAGVEWFLCEYSALAPEIAYHYGSSSANDGRDFHAVTAMLSLTAFFGGKAAKPEPMPVKKVREPADTDGDGVLDPGDRCPDTPRGLKVDAAGCPRMKKGEKVSITLNIQFETAKDVVRPQYRAKVAEVADFMKNYPDSRAEIEGHTDSLGSREYNLGLSQRRAESVRRYLIEQFGISPARVTARGYGPDRPIAGNTTRAGRRKNRRVVATLSAER